MATKKKEIRVKITAENKELFDALNSAVTGLKKFASAVAAIKKVKIGADGASEVKAALADVEEQAKGTAEAVKKVGTDGAQGLDAGTKKAGEVGKALDDVEKKAEKVAKSIKKIGTQTGAGATGVKVSASTIKPAAVSTAGLDESAQKAAEVEKALVEVEAQAQKTSRSIRKIGEHAGAGATGVKVSASAYRDAAAAAKSAGDSAKGAGNEGARAGEKVRTGARRGAAALREAKESASAFGQTLANVTIIAHGVFSVLGQIKDVLTRVIAPGFDFTKQIEASRMGIAGIIQSMTRLNNRTLSFAEAMSISSDMMKKLMADAVRTGAEAEELIPTFQAILSPGLAAGMTLEQIRDITNYGANAVKAIMPGDIDRQRQMIQEVRDLVQGGIQPASSSLANALNITDADIKRAKNSSEGLYKFLMDRFIKLRDMMDAYPQTLDGTISQFREVWTRASAVITESFGEEFKTFLRTLTNFLGEIDEKTGEIKINPVIIETARELGSVLESTILKTVTLAKQLAPVLSPAVPILKFIGNHVVIIGAGLGTWVIAGMVINTIKGVGTAIMVVEGVLKTGTRAWRAYNLAIALGSTNMKAFAIATRTANVGLTTFKITVRGLLASTGIGLLAVGVGYLAEKMLGLADSTDKANDAYRRYKSSSKGAGGIGFASVPFEAGPDANPGTVSPGTGDPGGKSYGLWQLSSNMGTLQSFIKWLNQEGYQAGKFLEQADDIWDGVTWLPGHSIELASAEFDARWKEAAQNFGESFIEAQQRYIKETHYNPQIKALQSMGIDVTSRSKALQEAVWSTAVQHRGATPNIVKEAFERVGGFGDDDTDLVKAIYEIRARYIRNDRYLPEETKNSVIDRYFRADGELNTMLAENLFPGGVPTNLSPAFPKEQEEAIAKALRAATTAAQENYLNEYLAQLENERTTLKQGHELGQIDIKEYYAKLADLTIRESTARITKLQQDIVANQELLNNKSLTDDDRIKINSDIETLMSSIRIEKTKLENALSSNTFEGLQAFKDLSDKAIDVMIDRLEMQGKYVEAVNKKLAKSSTQLAIDQLRISGFEVEAQALEAANSASLIEAQLTESTANISYAVEDMQLAQGKMIQNVVDGTTTVADSVKQFQTEFDTKILDDVTKLKALLAEAKRLGLTAMAREIETKLREVKGTVIDYISALIAALDDDLQAQIDKINADKGLTPLQKADLIEEAERATAGKKAAAYGLQANAYDARGDKGDEQASKIAIGQGTLNQKTSEYDTLLKKVHQTARDTFEGGLTEFLSESIVQCETLADAFRDLANTVLSAIRRIYAEQITKNLMAMLGMATSTGNRPTIDGVPVQGPLKPDGTFAEGGSFVDSFGVAHGPGSSTSDSILAYAQKFGKIINIGNGEGIMTGVAVRNLGHRALAALNAGVDPRRIFKNYATGGVLSDAAADIPGPQEIAASLVNNNSTTIPLSIMNVLDPEIMGKYLGTREGKRALLNHIKADAATIRQILNIRG